MPTVLLLELHPKAGPDRVPAILDSLGVDFTTVTLEMVDDKPIPDPDDYRALMIFGSPKSCSDIPDDPRLTWAYAFTRAAILSHRAILGVCFGAQMVAKALGARVYRNETSEAGICPVHLTEAGVASPLFDGFAPQFQVLECHRDTFTLPPGATLLADSPSGCLQAYVHHRCAGVQFHPETTAQTFEGWITENPDILSEGGRDPAQLLADCQAGESQQADLCRRLVGNFLRMYDLL